MTKINSVNYTAPNTNFPLASEATDALKKEDLFTLQRALDQHTHDNTRGQPTRRVETTAAPGQAGQVQINGDALRWWGSVAAAIRTAANLEGDQAWTGEQTFNVPLRLLQQVSTPAAPGVGLTRIYAKPDGLLYRRSGTGAETPVGSPPGVAFVAKGMDTLGSAGWAELRQVQQGLALDWLLTFDGTAPECAGFSFPIPYGYLGSPIRIFVQYRAPSVTSGGVAFSVLGSATATNGDPNQALTPLVTPTAQTVPATAGRKGLITLDWTATVPNANDWVKCLLYREATFAGDTVTSDIDVYGITVAFG